MSLMSTLPNQIYNFVANHAYAAAAVGAVAVTGAIGVAVRNNQMAAEAARNAADEAARKQAEYLNSTDYKAKTLFEELKIKEWYLPVSDGTVSVGTLSSKAPTPIFSKETTEDVNKVKEMIKKSQQNQETSPLPNLIFQGKAGVGKTTLAEDLCRETKIGFIRIPSGTMENHITRATHITTLHKIIDIADRCSQPVYILMDDGEGLVAKRTAEGPKDDVDTTKAFWLVEQQKIGDVIAQRRTALVNAILEESGKDMRKVSFIVTTNRPEVIDSAFLTRARVLKIDPPASEERKQIIITHLPKVFNNDLNYLDFFKKGRLEDMAVKTEGFTGRNIVKMLEDIFACVQLEKGDITQEIVDASIYAMRNSLEKDTPKVQPQVIATQVVPTTVVQPQQAASAA